jgi:hypothetical protein
MSMSYITRRRHGRHPRNVWRDWKPTVTCNLHPKTRMDVLNVKKQYHLDILNGLFPHPEYIAERFIFCDLPMDIIDYIIFLYVKDKAIDLSENYWNDIIKNTSSKTYSPFSVNDLNQYRSLVSGAQFREICDLYHCNLREYKNKLDVYYTRLNDLYNEYRVGNSHHISLGTRRGLNENFIIPPTGVHHGMMHIIRYFDMVCSGPNKMNLAFNSTELGQFTLLGSNKTFVSFVSKCRKNMIKYLTPSNRMKAYTYILGRCDSVSFDLINRKDGYNVQMYIVERGKNNHEYNFTTSLEIRDWWQIIVDVSKMEIFYHNMLLNSITNFVLSEKMRSVLDLSKNLEQIICNFMERNDILGYFEHHIWMFRIDVFRKLLTTRHSLTEYVRRLPDIRWDLFARDTRDLLISYFIFYPRNVEIIHMFLDVETARKIIYSNVQEYYGYIYDVSMSIGERPPKHVCQLMVEKMIIDRSIPTPRESKYDVEMMNIILTDEELWYPLAMKIPKIFMTYISSIINKDNVPHNTDRFVNHYGVIVPRTRNSIKYVNTNFLLNHQELFNLSVCSFPRNAKKLCNHKLMRYSTLATIMTENPQVVKYVMKNLNNERKESVMGDVDLWKRLITLRPELSRYSLS